ncbi:Piso0_005138 [Millerozyma farinosa CBS 7064]|uniref:Piso0_005138 protein n=1 Tax=Pichia sorbitophila (strain ATCC MYA-4447 / BCRC 22081 / CBS 7064 / NBRC 10061 / NRRL Y-12695) TaxID=559304 RepID=G8Y4B6_PICSO|nr:Piso0_005138 [Millerozyma farinosa CBS 7064]
MLSSSNHEPSAIRSMFGVKGHATSKNTSLEFYCIRAKNVLTTLVNDQSGKWSDDLVLYTQECLQHINKQIELSTADFNTTHEKVLVVLQNDVYILLGSLGILNVPRRIFDQQILLLKRLVNCLLSDDASHRPIVQAMNYQRIKQNVAKCFGLYSVDFTCYDDMDTAQKSFVMSLIPKIISIYDKYPAILQFWLDELCHDYSVSECLRRRASLMMLPDLGEWKYFPLYDLLYSMLVSKKNVDQEFAETQFLALIAVLRKNSSPSFLKWLQKYADIPGCFLSKIIEEFNKTLPDNHRTNLKSFRSLILVYFKVAQLLPQSLKEQYLRTIREEFIYKVLEFYVSEKAISAFYHGTMVVELSLSFSNDIVFYQHILTVLNSDTWCSIVTSLVRSEARLTFKLTMLKLLDNIIKTNNINLIREVFCFSEPLVGNCQAPQGSLRVQAMKVAKCQLDESKIDFANSFLQILEKARSSKKNGVANYIYDNNKVASYLINSIAINFFQNHPECNLVLHRILVSLLSLQNGYINNICSNDVENYPSDLKLIIDFLYQAFLNYSDMIIEYREKKYQTMNSAKTFNNDEQEFLRPTIQFLEQLSSPDFDIPATDIDFELLSANMINFQKFFVDIYFCCKLRDLHQQACMSKSQSAIKT